MTALLLLAWAVTGALIARAHDTDWRRWTPISMVFGPLWLAIASEQERAQD